MLKTTEQYIIDANKKHNNRYTYENVVYTGAKNKIDIACPTHGSFIKIANDHLNGQICPSCKKEESKGKTYTTEKYIELCKETHGDRYDYSETKYIKNNMKVGVRCRSHGIFSITALHHRRGGNCPHCNIEKGRSLRTTEEYIRKANKAHNKLYDYTNTVYTGARNYVKIGCPKHGEFKQVAYYHLQGSGCQQCSASKGELEVSRILEQLNLKFLREESLGCYNKTGAKLFYDFYIPELKTIIEYDGIQHFKPIRFHSSQSKEDAKQSLIESKERDRIKNNYAVDNGYVIIRIPYTKINEIENILYDNLTRH